MSLLIAAIETTSGQPEVSTGVAETLIFAVIVSSIAILTGWFVFQRGPAALLSAPPRRNCVPLYLPFLLVAAWISLGVMTSYVIMWLLPKTAAGDEFISYFAAAAIEVVMTAGTLAIAAVLFPRGLKGFGLDLRSVPRDLPVAFVNLVAVLPLVWLGVWVVDLVGKWFLGPHFEIRANEGLETLTENPEPFMRILMLTFVLLIVPLFEEVLFRGMIQSTLRGYVRSAWLAIVITSILFAVMHPWQHWLAIFILSLAMGYACERSGSLFRPIFMHVLFNATNVLAALLAS